jgi:tungstate transport system permease protein
MHYLLDAIKEAFRILASGDPEFLGIVWISVGVATTSTALATLLGVPFGVLVANNRFRGKKALVTGLNTLMSLPTVVVGLLVYAFLSRQGPLGPLNLLFTPAAMVTGQVILAFPIVSGLTISAVQNLDSRILPTVVSLGAGRAQGFRMFLHEARFGVLAAVIAGFGRVFAEIGVSMMLGGNIAGHTRNITTAIAMEVGKGDFALGLALGIVLLAIALGVNIIFGFCRKKAR